ncbi:phosphoribosylformylglycinamidine synthase [Nonlabens ulvanivorans]|uniref:Phosphoribosylformylglycinamidine synthase n=2 Tax=Nonlabens TaxID=363408 RepID=A0A084JWQ6_NONUL|nr:phosphoribosylformylglycinamidine synthase [Nonlabens ulvanivorans]KEZ93390.1 phosphoribosylformylglycinamidine synthase [Nonlabens ulvanivorans]PRX13975.1 phosphoribosylformylglycinamidine synthase [Nonlabens ulvanivorans]
MIHFYGNPSKSVYAVQTQAPISAEDDQKLQWLFADAPKLEADALSGFFTGPRATTITPWSTNAVEITQNMEIKGILRIEQFHTCEESSPYDKMLLQKFDGLNQSQFDINVTADGVLEIDDIAAYNMQEGLSLSDDEIDYLIQLSEKLDRKLTDSEVFGFSQVNSEHCRHKIFNGTFIIDGEEMPTSLFKLIKETSKRWPNGIVSAYSDNVAFVEGPQAEQFAPKTANKPDVYQTSLFDSVISLKAETHNFPTTVEPFNGAATGSGGEIRDRLAGGQGSLPLAGTAVYMTSYSRLNEERPWENGFEVRKWLYQTPMDILIKASNGASDFGNKFGQPLITGSVLTFEHQEGDQNLGFDKVIMQAGGIGYGKKEQALKKTPDAGDDIIVMGGDNYRIGMGGAAVSSADTGALDSGLELNAVQRSNPEMQKRAANAIRGLVESDNNPIKSIHDHGAGGHLNCLSELVEETGGVIDVDALPVGDPTLSRKELIGNESQERMGLVMDTKDTPVLEEIAARERAPLYKVGKVTGDNKFTFSEKDGRSPMDLALEDMFGSSPKTIMDDKTIKRTYAPVTYDGKDFNLYLYQVLQLEAVACKDWLTNKVDRCVTGRVAKQQTCGELQLPLNNVGVMAMDYNGKNGVATTIGHAPVAALIDPAAGSRNAIAESLTNLVFAPLEKGLKGVSLSANWMWPCNNPGEDARLYSAVKAVSDFAIELGINIPTGKDSLSMKQKYPDMDVLAPGTVIISTVGSCDDISKVVEPVLQRDENAPIYYINMSGDDHKLGGSSFAQTRNTIGDECPTIVNSDAFAKAFTAIQNLIKQGKVLAGHDVASGGLITTLLEMCFPSLGVGMDLDLSGVGHDMVKVLFAENAGIVLQVTDESVESELLKAEVPFYKIGHAIDEAVLDINDHIIDVDDMRDVWYETSRLLDQQQSFNGMADERAVNYVEQPLEFNFPAHFTGKLPELPQKRIKAAVIREKGSNSEREMARAMYLAGFEVIDVHMTDLIAGRETLEDVQFIAAVGGFSNSDVLGSAKGWAGAFLYNEKANTALKNFFARPDTMSIGVCNGCQLFVELGLINPDHDEKPKMLHNASGKFECNFTSVEIAKNNSIMLQSLEGSKLGIWAAHGEGKFHLPKDRSAYQIPATYGYDSYPANPNGSDYNAAMLNSEDGRHLVMMPHLERSTFSWNWAHYPTDRKNDEVTPWLEAFVNARVWLERK